MAYPAFSYLDGDNFQVFEQPPSEGSTDYLRPDRLRYGYEVQSPSGRVPLRYVTKTPRFARFFFNLISESFFDMLDDFTQRKIVRYYPNSGSLGEFITAVILTEVLPVTENDGLISTQLEWEEFS